MGRLGFHVVIHLLLVGNREVNVNAQQRYYSNSISIVAIVNQAEHIVYVYLPTEGYENGLFWNYIYRLSISHIYNYIN